MASVRAPENANMPERIAVVEAVQTEANRRMNRFEAGMDRLEAKMDRLLFALLGAAVVILGAMSAGFWAVIANA